MVGIVNTIYRCGIWSSDIIVICPRSQSKCLYKLLEILQLLSRHLEVLRNVDALYLIPSSQTTCERSKAGIAAVPISQKLSPNPVKWFTKGNPAN